MTRNAALELEKAIIDRLKEKRIEQGISHERLASLTGLSRAAISMIESGARHPTLLSCIRIAEALGESRMFAAK